VLFPGEKIERDPFATPADPVRGLTPVEKVARLKHVKRDSPIGGFRVFDWDHDAVTGALVAHCQGNFAASAELCDAVMGDAKVQSVLGSRLAAMLGATVTHRRSRDGDAAMSRAVLDAWRDGYTKLAPNSVVSDLKRYADMLGFAIAELQWDTSRAIWRPRLKVWHPRYTYFDLQERCFVVMTMDGPERITPGDGRWFLHAPHGLYRGWMQGAIRAVAPAWVERDEALESWSSYNRIHGMPTAVLDVPATARASEVEEIARGIGAKDGASLLIATQGQDGQGYKLSYSEPTTISWEGFKARIEQCNNDIEWALLWQPASAEAGATTGSREHAGARQALLEFDERTFVDDLREQVARPFAEFNFGDADLAPHTHYEIEPEEDLQKKLSSLESFTRSLSAMNGAGFEFNAQSMARGYGVYVPGLVKTGNGQPYTNATTAISDGAAVGTGAGAPQPGKQP
jgi:Protein of unknown function (DUF935)